jgi:acyl-ACP thioesterase
MNFAPTENKMNYDVKVYEADNLGRAGLFTLFNYFQNSAWAHYNEVDKARGPFLTKDQIWAMTRVEIHLKRYAKWQENVEVETWSRGIEKLMAYRDFTIKDSMGAVIAAGTASWVVLDLKNKRIQRLSEMAPMWPSKPDIFSINKNAEKICSPASVEFGGIYEINYSDMDVNQHVNSARYIQWMIDSLGRDFLEKNELKKCEINFVDEAMPGEVIITGRQRIEPGVWLINVVRKNDNKEMARGKFEF